MNISDPNKLLEKDPELMNFIQAQEEELRFSKVIDKVTEQCWNMCITTPPSRLDSKTESCLVNCVDRFIDASNEMIKHFSSKIEAEASKQEFAMPLNDHTTGIEAFAPIEEENSNKSKFKFW